VHWQASLDGLDLDYERTLHEEVHSIATLRAPLAL